MQKEAEEAMQGCQNAEEKAKKAATEVGPWLPAHSCLPELTGAVARKDSIDSPYSQGGD